MPGPRNSKRQKKQQAGKSQSRLRKALKEVEQNTSLASDALGVTIEGKSRTRIVESTSGRSENTQGLMDASLCGYCHDNLSNTLAVVHAHAPFIVNPGNGPRVKNMTDYLSSNFCPPISFDNADCLTFAKDEIVTVLEALLPREIALITWYNRTRSYERICPSCQRVYRLGDSLLDPIDGEVIDVNNPKTPPHVMREQHLSGFCSFPCFSVACFSSHPYTTEVASGTWGLLADELDPRVRSILDATDPRTAAIIRYGLAACPAAQGNDQVHNAEDQGLGRVLRLTRRKDLGIGEVLQALAWYDNEERTARSAQRESK